ncbi:hypothetical protein [Streptomyces sp. WMMC897]|uniref:hypothetical protein n=1 Tax=Streptomyces sp. WMMC897 TaxID=3014782 RepID=UPI0022B72D54|nr:hypothetical protein [Streptomyces sp. WMMC897]MCZ7413033.1 hypothetical protein [Streptomyces sp. WMMC897]MCZ7413085.1 hypothetical protein [Streptomyces sp. WMMC897]MCZ7415443.1 hypothetical protein [Streptomyces sp. WMMC897]
MAYEVWQPGMRINATRLRSISPTWSDWTPTWSTTTGANTPSFGNALVTARYAQSALTVHWWIDIAFGSTTSFGGGGTGDNWLFSLPVTAAGSQDICGFGSAEDASNVSGSRLPVRVRCFDANHFNLDTAGGRQDGTALANTGAIDALTPWTWASGDDIWIQGTYEAAG